MNYIISDLPEAKRWFQRWTGFYFWRNLTKSGSLVAAVYYRPEPPSERYCLTFKRDWYRNFSFHFQHVPDVGWGQITSLNLLEYCERAHIAWLVAVMPDEVAYKVTVLDFLKYYRDYKTDVPHLPGEVACPIKMWERFFP